MDSITADSSDSTATPQTSILTLNNDILLLICAALAAEGELIVPRPLLSIPSPLKQFSATCKRLRALASPLIFRNIKLGAYGWSLDDHHLAITRMRNTPAVQRHTKRLSVDHFSAFRGNESQKALPNAFMFFDLVELLQSMMKLDRLDLSALNGSEEYLEALKGAFATSPPLTFEGVRALAIPCRMHWVVERFPNLRCLDVQAGNATTQSPVEAIRQVPGLQHLECKARWTPELLREVHQVAPELKTLTMQSSWPQYSKPVFDFVPTLAQFNGLRCLVLAPIGYLHVGFTAPRCGNAYQGKNGDQVRERVRKERERLSGLVAEAVFAKCKGLEELWIGKGGRYCRAICVRGGEGAVKEIQWSMGQWLEPAGRV